MRFGNPWIDLAVLLAGAISRSGRLHDAQRGTAGPVWASRRAVRVSAETTWGEWLMAQLLQG